MKTKSLYTTIPVVLFCALSIDPVIADHHPVGNVQAGKLKSILCSGCHGVNGEGKEKTEDQPAYPRLAGQIPGYFIKSLYDYKNDKRNDPLMNALTKSLSDADIANFAAYYLTLE